MSSLNHAVLRCPSQCLRAIKTASQLCQDILMQNVRLKAQIESIKTFLLQIQQNITESLVTQAEAEDLYEDVYNCADTIVKQLLGRFRLERTDFQCDRIYAAVTQEPQLPYEQQIKQKLKLDLKEPNYHKTINELCNRITEILTEMKFTKERQISKSVISQFVLDICQRYPINSFSNFTHAYEMTVELAKAAQAVGLSNAAQPHQIFFGMIACLGHGIDETGVSAQFLSRNLSLVVVRYSFLNASERYAASKLLQLIKESHSTPFDFVPKQQLPSIRKLIYQMVLATQQTPRSDLINILRTKTLNLTQADDRYKLMEILIHACQSSYATLPFEDCLRWSHFLAKQRHRIVKRQQEVAQRCSITSTNLSNIHPPINLASQFLTHEAANINNNIFPFWQQFHNRYPSTYTDRKLAQLQANAKQMKELAQKFSK